jgi:hypothetical protein
MYGIDWDGPSPADNGTTMVVVPKIDCDLNEEQLVQLRSTIDPLASSDSFGVDIYMKTRDFLAELYND